MSPLSSSFVPVNNLVSPLSSSLTYYKGNYKGVHRVTGKPGMPEQPGSAGTALFLRILSCVLFWLFKLQLMCTNYISGLPSRALSLRAEQLLKINIDVDIKLLVND